MMVPLLKICRSSPGKLYEILSSYDNDGHGGPSDHEGDAVC